MKNKKVIIIITILLILGFVVAYLTINKMYESARKNNMECCPCKDAPYADVCCECDYDVLEKISYIIENK